MTLSHSMLAIEISEPGGPDVLKPVSVPVPVPGHGQIIIRVAYAGVNRPDALQRAGAYAPPPSASPLPGLECSGTVVEVGPGVTRWQIGDRVCALLPGGGYAEYCRADAGHCLPVPDGLSLAEAAARRAEMDKKAQDLASQREVNGRGGHDPVRYEDWEVKGLAIDF